MRFSFPAIQHLLRFRRPSDIAGLVIAVVVDSIYAQMRSGASANISDKVLEALQLPLTYRNSAPAVVLVGFLFGIVATLNHGGANTVFRPAPDSVTGCAMRCIATANQFKSEASTASSTLIPKFSPDDDFRFPAIAKTKPVRNRFRANSTNNQKAFKSFSGEVNQISMHGALILT